MPAPKNNFVAKQGTVRGVSGSVPRPSDKIVKQTTNPDLKDVRAKS